MTRPGDGERAHRGNGSDSFTPATSEDENARRSIDWDAFSHAFVPMGLRSRAIAVDVSTDRDVYDAGEPVRITVEFRNRLPFPIRLRTDSPNRWTWAVDDVTAASTVPRTVPDRPSAFSFARGERKRFHRTWSQRIRVDEREWVPVESGTHALSARVNRDDAVDRGLIDRTTIEIEDGR
ncbi:hypothetical protein EA462_01125 [Natrarchaeobius halalkaliphilus]|uniref:DUF7974 domain-containing protein n=1 Tax=Natrarchaeobius halalkaliphilus TaxID=1679091 RepID=A0A3N6MG05_9EURY|nr:hypothetical protein [Natrarchaeobius halalkaliphilus]RQG92856.1 hypothetical protein EA462_01125 [Natrarchaeobius halalkaliphilus]